MRLLFLFLTLTSCGIDEIITPNTENFIEYSVFDEYIHFIITSTEPTTTFEYKINGETLYHAVNRHHYGCVTMPFSNEYIIYNNSQYYKLEL